MANTGKNLSRKNTSRAQGVISFIRHVETTLLYILLNPDTVDEKNKLLKATEDSLVKQYGYSVTVKGKRVYKSVTVEMSGVKLRALYGDVGLKLWSKLFVCIRKGGWSKVHKRSYETIWSMNEAAFKLIDDRKQPLLASGQVPVSFYYEVLEGIEPLIATALDDVITKDKDGLLKHTAVNRKLVTLPERREILKVRRDKKEMVVDHNDMLRKVEYLHEELEPVLEAA